MTSINPVDQANIVVQPKGSSQKPLGETEFLTLLTTQLKQQDPFEPVDNKEMIAQMAQFSSLAGINQMNDTLKSISDRLGAQTAILTDIKNSPVVSTNATTTSL